MSSSPSTDSFESVVAEIRSSLSVASTVIVAETSNGSRSSSAASTEGTACLGFPSAESDATASGGLTETAVAAPPSPATVPTLEFVGGRLKYSHVKREWILRHDAVQLLDSNEMSTQDLHPATPKATSRRIANIVASAASTAAYPPSNCAIEPTLGSKGVEETLTDSKPPAKPERRRRPRTQVNGVMRDSLFLAKQQKPGMVLANKESGGANPTSAGKEYRPRRLESRDSLEITREHHPELAHHTNDKNAKVDE